MFQPAKVTAVRARELEAASAAAAFRERAAHLDDAAQARKNMQEVSLASWTCAGGTCKRIYCNIYCNDRMIASSGDVEEVEFVYLTQEMDLSQPLGPVADCISLSELVSALVRNV